jgi:hypothetical protein
VKWRESYSFLNKKINVLALFHHQQKRKPLSGTVEDLIELNFLLRLSRRNSDCYHPGTLLTKIIAKFKRVAKPTRADKKPQPLQKSKQDSKIIVLLQF